MRMIEQYYLLNQLNAEWDKRDKELDDEAIGGLSVAIDLVKEIPTIDIILCNDCKHYHTHDHRCKVWNHGVKLNEYCSRGEENEID